MSKVLDEAVEQVKGGTWDFQCPGVSGDPCWTTDGVPFRSSGWPTKKSAAARGAQHLAEHKANLTGGDPQPMQDLHEFRAEHGLVVNDDGSVSVEDL